MPEINAVDMVPRPVREHKQSFKRQKTAPSSSSILPIAPLKSKIRDLSRSLGHNDRMPADVRIEKERALAGYKQDLENAQNEKRRQAMIKRYHMVRFFGGSIEIRS